MKKKTITVVAFAVTALFSSVALAQETYSVVRGDNLTKIGQRFGVTYQEIMAANGLSNTVIHPGQVLTIPTGNTYAAPAPNSYSDERFSAPTPPSYSSPNTGDNRFGYNGYAGPGTNYAPAPTYPVAPAPTVNTIPPPVTCAPAPPVVDPKNFTNPTYVVRSGDSVWGISRKYSVNPWSLRRANKLSLSRIYPGQVLTIPVR